MRKGAITHVDTPNQGCAVFASTGAAAAAVTHVYSSNRLVSNCTSWSVTQLCVSVVIEDFSLGVSERSLL